MLLLIIVLQCAQIAGINVTAIYECMNTSAASSYYHDFGVEFKKFNIENVPAVGFNNVSISSC